MVRHLQALKGKRPSSRPYMMIPSAQISTYFRHRQCFAMDFVLVSVHFQWISGAISE